MNNLIRTEATFVLNRKMPSVVYYLYNHSYPLKNNARKYIVIVTWNMRVQVFFFFHFSNKKIEVICLFYGIKKWRQTIWTKSYFWNQPQAVCFVIQAYPMPLYIQTNSRVQTPDHQIYCKISLPQITLLKPHEGLALVHSQNRKFSLEMYTYIYKWILTYQVNGVFPQTYMNQPTDCPIRRGDPTNLEP